MRQMAGGSCVEKGTPLAGSGLAGVGVGVDCQQKCFLQSAKSDVGKCAA